MILISLKDLRHHWFEYVLGAIIISVVTAAMVVVSSVTSSAEKEIHTLAHKLGKNMLVLSEETDLSDFYMQKYDSYGMDDTYPEKIRTSNLGRHIGFSEAILYGNAVVNNLPVIVVGEDNNWFNRLNNSTHSQNAILGADAATQLGLKEGDSFDINGFSLRVAGVSASLPEGLGSGVITYLETAQQILDRPGKITAIRLGGCWCRTDVAGLAKDVEKLLPGTKAITLAGVLRAQKESVKVMSSYSGVIYAVMISIMAALIMILMVSQVRRQMRGIGLLIAIGSPLWIITAIFCFRAVLVGVLGGAFGYSLGFPLTKYFATEFTGMSLSVSAGLFLPLLAVCVLVSVFSAFIPAFRATKLDPTEILREV